MNHCFDRDYFFCRAFVAGDNPNDVIEDRMLSFKPERTVFDLQEMHQKMASVLAHS